MICDGERESVVANEIRRVHLRAPSLRLVGGLSVSSEELMVGFW